MLRAVAEAVGLSAADVLRLGIREKYSARFGADAKPLKAKR